MGILDHRNTPKHPKHTRRQNIHRTPE